LGYELRLIANSKYRYLHEDHCMRLHAAAQHANRHLLCSSIECHIDYTSISPIFLRKTKKFSTSTRLTAGRLITATMTRSTNKLS